MDPSTFITCVLFVVIGICIGVAIGIWCEKGDSFNSVQRYRELLASMNSLTDELREKIQAKDDLIKTLMSERDKLHPENFDLKHTLKRTEVDLEKAKANNTELRRTLYDSVEKLEDVTSQFRTAVDGFGHRDDKPKADKPTHNDGKRYEPWYPGLVVSSDGITPSGIIASGVAETIPSDDIG